jgi:hypothetical protein
VDPFSMVVGIVFFTTVGRVITKSIDARAKRGGKLDAEAFKELEALRGERKLLVERIENLETIVCGVDLELNQKLNKVIDEQRLIASVAPAKDASAKESPKPPEHDRTMTAPPTPRVRSRRAGWCPATSSPTAIGSSGCSARAAWARCTSRTTRCSATSSRSR